MVLCVQIQVVQVVQSAITYFCSLSVLVPVHISLSGSSSHLSCVCSSQAPHILRMTRTVVRTPAKKTPSVCHVGVPKWERIPS